MTITFHIPPSAAEQVGFTSSPLMETVLSLHALIEPKHHPLQHEWVRRMRRLPVTLRREITAMAFAYRDYFPAFCFPPAQGPQPSFSEEVIRLRTLPLDQVREEFAVALIGEPARSASGVTPSPTPAWPGQPHPGQQTTTILRKILLDDPAIMLERFTDLVTDYWDIAFGEEWDRLGPALDQTITQVGAEIADRGLFGLLRRLAPEVGSSPTDGRFWLDRPHSHEVTLTPTDHLTLVPSEYVWPHVRVNCDPPWPLSVVFPAAYLHRRAEVSLAPRELVTVLRAVAEETRLRLLRLLTQQPRSTEELAPLLHLSPAALSKHLHVLARAGLVSSRRDGYYVLYTANPDRLSALAPSLHEFVDPTHNPAHDWTATDKP